MFYYYGGLLFIITEVFITMGFKRCTRIRKKIKQGKTYRIGTKWFKRGLLHTLSS